MQQPKTKQEMRAERLKQIEREGYNAGSSGESLHKFLTGISDPIEQTYFKLGHNRGLAELARRIREGQR